jgi:hypothetical protein
MGFLVGGFRWGNFSWLAKFFCGGRGGFGEITSKIYNIKIYNYNNV